jgi:hypothetical protein
MNRRGAEDAKKETRIYGRGAEDTERQRRIFNAKMQSGKDAKQKGRSSS